MIDDGMFAQVHYTGTLSNGEVFDSSENREPLEFKVGEKLVIPAFEDAVKDMKIDEEKEIFVKSDDAYGQYNDGLIQQVPIEEVKKSIEPVEGMTIHVMLQDGQHSPALIKEVTEETVSLDFNHPLAGQDLNFKLKLVAINQEAQQKCDDDDCSSCGDDCSHDHK